MKISQVVLVPRNGYVNRLQAWASTSVIADSLAVPLHVHWEREDVSPASASALFNLGSTPDVFVDNAWMTSLLGAHHSEFPRYLTYIPERKLVVLAGHDKGEQAFMDRLQKILGSASEPVTLLVIAGGRFWLPGETNFRAKRRHFYSSIPWSDAIRDRVRELSHDRGPYIALHSRGTDRSRTAPTTAALHRAVTALAERTGIRSIFVSADTHSGRSHWIQHLTRQHLAPWIIDGITHDRTAADAGVDAMVEWCVLGRSAGMVFSQESSFGHEAAVLTGQPCVGLQASAIRQRLRATKALSAAALTYSARKGRRTR